MSSDDRRRYLIIGSVMIEVVSPLLRKRLETSYQQHFGSLQDFLNSQPVKHILFHLRHRNSYCCSDKQRCINGKLPLYHSQWDLLYAENPGQTTHNCYCKYTAKTVQTDELDITLVSLIVLNCSTLSPADEHAIRNLRQFKNELFSHNTTGGIKKAEYDSHWGDIMTFVLQLDSSKQDDLIRLEHRPLDDLLCTKYFTCLLNICEVIERMGISIQQFHEILQRNNELNVENNRLLQQFQGIQQETNNVNVENNRLLQMIWSHISRDKTHQSDPIKSPSVGQNLNQQLELRKDIFTIEKTFSFRGVVEYVSNGILLDSGQIVLCSFISKILMIINIDDLRNEIIQLPNNPVQLSAINSSIVAVAYYTHTCIDIYDINNKMKTKSISLEKNVLGITTMNDKLVVAVKSGFHIIDYQTDNVMERIDIGQYYPYNIHAYGDRIYFQSFSGYKLYCYNVCTGKITKLKLSRHPVSMTTLRDGSLYVICVNKEGYFDTLLHVSSDCMKYKRVKIPGLKLFCLPYRNYTIRFNRNLRKMIIWDGHNVYVLHEK